MQRIDAYPTRRCAGYDLRAGRSLPFGASIVAGGVNFSIFSAAATACTLVLFAKGAEQPTAEIPFPSEFRIGNTWSMIVFGLDVESTEYGYRVDGPWDPAAGHRFDKTRILLDPYARAIGGRDVWGVLPNWADQYHHRGRLVLDDFDWESDRPLEIPMSDLVVYEAHARGFTRSPTSQVRFPGTFGGIREKIPYLKALGVNCLELLPIYAFDEFENSRVLPETGERLYNYWGYSTVGFFAPKAGYAATGKFGMEVDELKGLIKQLHKAGIEVMLDVVFNHTAEGNEMGPYISFRGLDNRTYYMLTPDGDYYNFSGTGNTLNCNHPVVRNMVLDCLRYWASEYHVDGFRFDLAAILGRDPSGAPLSNPPLLESLAADPVLAKCKLVAEAWDAGGLYQVGSFPAYGRWAEWNGRYRDTMRRFLKGDPGLVGDVATRLMGSPDLYGGRGTAASINFVTCHDGFTLYDLVSYNDKHNESNGENNRDGANDNHSWNWGAEGSTDDPQINALRRRQIKNAVTLLMLSQGVPMLLMGDEVGRTQQGNNNTYCHDSELNWMDWSALDRSADLLRYFQKIIRFRHAHPVLRSRGHLTGHSYATGLADVTWHGTRAWSADWGSGSRVIAFMLNGSAALDGTVRDDDIYVAINMHWDTLEFQPPAAPDGRQWYVAANTGAPGGEDVWDCGSEPRLANQDSLWLGARSIGVLVSKCLPRA
jgi:isoamylase